MSKRLVFKNQLNGWTIRDTDGRYYPFAYWKTALRVATTEHRNLGRLFGLASSDAARTRVSA